MSLAGSPERLLEELVPPLFIIIPLSPINMAPLLFNVMSFGRMSGREGPSHLNTRSA